MKLLIDEDTAVQLVEPLRHVLVGHEVAHISGLSWKGKKDRQVLPDAKGAGYHALITRDRAQFSDPGECDAIKKSGLHHVRYGQRQGTLSWSVRARLSSTGNSWNDDGSPGRMQPPPGKPPRGNVCLEVGQLRCGQVAADRSLEASCVIIALFCGQTVRLFGRRPFGGICHIDK